LRIRLTACAWSADPISDSQRPLDCEQSGIRRPVAALPKAVAVGSVAAQYTRWLSNWSDCRSQPATTETGGFVAATAN
jgi:hypothetical protein